MPNTSKKYIHVAMFSGGRGTTSITRALLSHPQIRLTLLVNAYDDGLSTGRLRRFISGMLGPSDIRKNYSTILSVGSERAKALGQLLEYRFPLNIDNETVLKNLQGVTRFELDALLPEFLEAYSKIPLEIAKKLQGSLTKFLDYYKTQNAIHPFSFADCSFGNLVFAGHFLQEGSFNKAIESFCSLVPVPATVQNITQGENLVLLGLKKEGTLLEDEAAVVSEQSASPLEEIFLLENYLTPLQKETLLKQNENHRKGALRELSVIPKANPSALSSLREADLIIYGPGTQHSSLFPSYLTEGVLEVIRGNIEAEKILISNILKDNEIMTESLSTLIGKFLFYMGRKETHVELDQVVTHCFSQRSEPSASAANYLADDTDTKSLPITHIVGSDWESQTGQHLGGKVALELIAIANQRAQVQLKPLPYMVSIVVPALNESKTISRVLHELFLLDFSSLGVSKEIIFVDGGSDDGTFEVGCKRAGVRGFQLKDGLGRGHALRYGAQKAKGDMIVFFPSDGEYEPADLLKIVQPLISQEFPIVFGSRAIKCVNLGDRIKSIYVGDRLGFWISKWGGMLLSVLSLAFFNRFISDPLTGVKGFRSNVFKSLGLTANGLDLETEVIAKAAKQRLFILEVPVEFYPRKKKDGKKTTLKDGFQALFSFFRLGKGTK